MPLPAQMINPTKGLYIKLGTSGRWENESINSGILRFGYKETPFEAAVSGDWEAVRKVWLANRKNEGVATSDLTQIRYFFEADVTEEIFNRARHPLKSAMHKLAKLLGMLTFAEQRRSDICHEGPKAGGYGLAGSRIFRHNLN